MIEGCDGGGCAKAIIEKWRRVGSSAPAYIQTFSSDGRIKLDAEGKSFTQGYRFVDGTRYRIWGRGIPPTLRLHMQVGIEGDRMTTTFDGRRVQRYERVR